jgi:hypothetical protein
VVDCIFKASSANYQKMGTGYDPFDVGLFFGGWSRVNIIGEILKKQPDFSQQAQQTTEAEKILWDTYVALRKKVNLNDDQVIEASGLKADVISSKVAATVAKYGD